MPVDEPHLRETAKYMRWELEQSCLEVILIPSRFPEVAESGGMIRVAISKNTCWYRQFCADFSSGRRRQRKNHDTLIKRRHVLRALVEIEAGQAITIYAERLLPYVHRYHDNLHS